MIKILIDSGCDVEEDLAKQLGITVLPFPVRFGDEEYLDGFTLSHRQFFEKLIESSDLPQTSQINEFVYDEQFAALTADGSQVIAITLSSKFSGTHASAVKAAKKYKDKVFVVDSLNACIGERVLLDYCIRLVNQGKMSAEQIVDELNAVKGKIRLLAVLDTLKYLRKGGRISSVTAIAGEMLSIKPVVTVAEGDVKLIGKAIGTKNGHNLLNQLIAKCGGIDFSKPYVLAYSGLSDSILKKYIATSGSLWKSDSQEIPYYLIGSTIGTHVGPGGIAVAFFENR